MSKLRLHGTSSGYTDIAPTAAAGNNTLTAPTGTGTIVIKDGSGAIGITSVQATNANFSGTTRITSGISTTLNITTSRINTGIVTTFTATNSTFAGDIDPSANGVYDIGASNLKFKQIFVNNIDVSTGVVTATAFVPTTGHLSRRNLIINGGMKVAQRGTVDQLLYNYAGPDRFKFDGDGSQRSEVSQATLTVDDKGQDHAWRFDVRTANASPSAGHFQLVSYRFEGQDLQHLKKGTSAAEALTLQFWIKSPKAGTHIVELVDQSNSARHINKAYTVSSANTWQYITVTFPGDTTGAITNDSARRLDLNFWLMAGSTYNSGTLQTSWGSDTNANRAVGQVNCVDDAANNFYMTGVQLEVGSVATPFEHNTYADELRRCQRYYYLHGTGSSTSYGLQGTGMMGLNGSTVTGKIIMWFPVPMRTKPSATWANANEFRNDTGLAANDSTFGAIWSDATSVNSAWVDFPGGSGSNFSESKACMVYSRSGSNAKMAFSAEL